MVPKSETPQTDPTDPTDSTSITSTSGDDSMSINSRKSSTGHESSHVHNLQRYFYANIWGKCIETDEKSLDIARGSILMQWAAAQTSVNVNDHDRIPYHSNDAIMYTW